MVNLLKFKPHAEYQGGSDSHLTGAGAYNRYGEGVTRLVQGLGGRILYSGRVTGLLLGGVGRCGPGPAPVAGGFPDHGPGHARH